MNKLQISDFVAQFRMSAPYINAFRGKTFVIYINGNAILSELFITIIQDIALLDSLGIKLVLIPGCRPQINRLLSEDSILIDDVRVTNNLALDAAKHAAGNVRIEFEALFSRVLKVTNHLSNSGEEPAGIRVTSGNFVKAKPYGIRNGVDFKHTGEVRNIDHVAISTELDHGHIVLLSSLAYSSTGEVFNLCAENVAAELAKNLQADKLLYLFDDDIVKDADDNVIRQLVLEQIDQTIEQASTLSDYAKKMLLISADCCNNNVKRVHLLNAKINGGLLQELFTSDGIGCLISINPYEGTRPANIEDISGILALIEPLESEGILARRSREKLELDVNHFIVTVRDGMVLACAALYTFEEYGSAELACLAVHPDYQHQGRGDALLRYLELQLIKAKLGQLFVLSTRTSHWFLDRDFVETEIDKLPLKRKALYNYQRNSKVYIKSLPSR